MTSTRTERTDHPPAHAVDTTWINYYRHKIAGNGKWKDFRDPYTVMRAEDVAHVIGVTVGAIYVYRRYGNILIPDIQEGGRDPDPGEMIVWRGKKNKATLRDGTVVLRPTSNERKPREGEKIHPRRVGWYAWRVYRWQAVERTGRGWHQTGKDRVRIADRPHTGLAPGEWMPPPPSMKRVILHQPAEGQVAK